MERARAAAAEVLSSQQLTAQLKGALVAYSFWVAGGDGGTKAGSEGSGGSSSSGTAAGGQGAGRSGISGV